MLWSLLVILLLLWMLGWGFHVAGTLVHLLLVIALVVFLIELITGRRAAA
ncbi:MAG TPA: lmo0937 family membrane protein [Candidatus Angelobacter sp.]|nr:lmo0937 family membrane protein [Candidatus Angelobacter sp.]